MGPLDCAVKRGDGRLTHDLLPMVSIDAVSDNAVSNNAVSAAAQADDPGPRDACGVFGVWAPGEEVAKLSYFGLYAFSTAARNQPASRSATAMGSSSTRTWAWSPRCFDERHLATLTGHLAIGHTRYSTTGSSNWENAQPTLRAHCGRHHRSGSQRQPDQHR